MIPISVCLLLGLASTSFLSFHIFLIIFLPPIIFSLIFYFKDRGRGELLFLFLLLGFILAGHLLANVTQKEYSFEKSPMVCEGKLTSYPQPKEDGWSLDINLDGCAENVGEPLKPLKGRVRFFTTELAGEFAKGDTVRFRGKIKEPKNFKNPGSFNYKRYLLTQGIQATGSLTSPRWIVKISGGKQHLFTNLITKTREQIRQGIDLATAGDTAEILKTVTIGDYKKISKETRELFARTGVAHLLSISGLHVSFLSIIIFILSWLLLGWCRHILLRLPIHILSSLITIPAIWFYVALADFPVSAVRAAIMFTIFILAFLSLRFRWDILSALAAAVFIILLVSPNLIFSLSFQLSFAAMASIILLSPRFALPLRNGITGSLQKTFVVTLAATIGTTPLIAYYFHYITGIGVLSNLVAVPLFGLLLMPLVVIGIVTNLIYLPLGIFIWRAAAAVVSGLIYFITAASNLFGTLIIHFAPSAFELILILAVIGTIILWSKLPYRRILILLLGGFILIDAAYWNIVMKRSLTVTFLDVGHGDSIVARLPGGRTMLIDGGGIKDSDFDVGRNVIAPALERLGIHGVDYLLLTHPHHDHYKGLAYIVERFGPKLLYTNGFDAPPDETDEWKIFQERIRSSGIETRVISPGENLSINEDSLSIKIFSPPTPPSENLDLNDTSLVVHILYKDHSILLTGDLTAKGESALLKEAGRDGYSFKSDLLKIAHHGSKTSSTGGFLKVIKPDIAVISVGENNIYGVPDEEVLDRLEKIGAKIYRTDKNGAVTASFSENSIKVTGYQ